MQRFYSSFAKVQTGGLGALLVLAAGTVLAQSPVIVSVSPAANARAAVRTGPVAATFSQPLVGGSAVALKVYSGQRGGLRSKGATPAVVSGSVLSFTPTAYGFQPGETVLATITRAAGSSNGSLAHAKVLQFTTAVGGPGRGNFQPGTDPTVVANPQSMVVGDVDGDGDLDLLVASSSANAVSVRLNGGDATGSNTGVFAGTQNVAVGASSQSLVLGDIDGDGDLDLLITNTGGGGGPGTTVSIRLNGGDATGSNTGLFSGTQNVAVGNGPRSVVLGDVDGDGDLDFLTANTSSSTVSVRLNGGDATGSNTGLFSGSQDVAVGSQPHGVVAADVDGDGDLDLLASSFAGNTVSIRLNGGDATGSNTGLFSGSQNVAVSTSPSEVKVADVDGDNDLDLLVVTHGSGTVSVRLNGGDATGSNTGVFSGTQNVAVDDFRHLAVADVDGDGDLDLLTASMTGSTVSVRLNGGDATGSNTGVFSGTQTVAVGINPFCLALADVDGDGDLDLLTASNSSSTVSVRLNGAAGPLAARSGAVAGGVTLAPNPAHDQVRVLGLAAAAPVQVLDALGREVATATADATGTASLLLPTGLPAGLYVVRTRTQTVRLLVE